MTHEDIEKLAIQSMAGPVAEQVFNIQDDAIVPKLLNKYWYKQMPVTVLTFEELLQRKSGQDDLALVREMASYVNGQDASASDVLGTGEDWYEKTLQFVKDHKSEIERVAHILETKKYISMDEIYAACGALRPKFDFEE